MTRWIGENGLRRNLRKNVEVKKRGVSYFGPLCESGDGKFYVQLNWFRQGERSETIDGRSPRVFINRPGKDEISIFHKGLICYRDYNFLSNDSNRYRAHRRSASKARENFLKKSNVITERGLRSNNSFLGFCSFQQPLGDGRYSDTRYGLISEDPEGELVILLGGGDFVGIEDLMWIGINQKNVDGTNRTNHYLFDARPKS